MPVGALGLGRSQPLPKHREQDPRIVDGVDRVALQAERSDRLSQSLAAGSARISSAVIVMSVSSMRCG
jgi:hypothetical protein